MPNVTLYTRRDCCLCDEALAVIERVRLDAGFDLVVVDVDTDPALADRYGQRVPVVALDGHDVFQYRVAEDELRVALEGQLPAARSEA